MADQDLMHTAEIVKAAMPYIDNRYRTKAELFVKMFELIGSFQSMKNSGNLAACGFENNKIDMEGLLNGIRPVCSHSEREIVDRVLNFFSMKKMFEMYNNLMETMKTMQEFGGFPFGDSSSANETDSVTGNFSGSNFESIFNSLKSSGQSDYDNNKQENTGDINEATDESSNNQKPQTDNPSGGMDDRMYEMFKAMVPPDKLGTFENLSMLLKTMSYDSNSKPDQKERNDG